MEPGTPPPEPAAGPWSKSVRDRWFYVFLACSTAAVVRLLWPFLTAIVFALVVVAVSLPVYRRVLHWCGGRSAVAALLTTFTLLLALFGPLLTLLSVFVQQAAGFVGVAVQWVQQGKLQEWATRITERVNIREMVPAPLQRFLPGDQDLLNAVMGPLQNGLVSALNAAGRAVPGLLNSTFGAVLDVIIFLAVVVTFYMEGPKLLRIIRNLSPLDDVYDDQLFKAFSGQANSLVRGALGTSAVMAVVAGLGFLLAGVDRVLFLAGMVGLFSFIPVVGIALVWIPVAVSQGLDHGWAAAAFVVGWNVIFTSQVDTLVRPLFMRGGLHIHPLLILLSLLGGVTWMGAAGALLGPVVVAFFLSLYRVYTGVYLGQPPPPPEPQVPGPLDRLTSWWAAKRARAAAAAPAEGAAAPTQGADSTSKAEKTG